MSWWQLALVGVLLIANAVFAGSEMALISLRESQLRRLERQSRTGMVVARLARDPNRFLATIQVGITLAGFLASATAAVSLARPLEPAFSFFGNAAGAVAVIVVTLALTFLTLVLGELAPKRVAMQRAEHWAMAVGRPLSFLATLSRPVVWVLGRSTDVVVRLFGADPGKHREEVTPDEIRDMAIAHRGFTPEQRMIISGAVEITERLLREIIVPRRDVFTLDVDTSVAEALTKLAAAGHSRAPVVRRGNLDDTVGVVHLRDLVARRADGLVGTVSDLVMPAVWLPDSLHVSDALRRFKTERQQFGLVVDEYGAVDGIVTLEDLLEEVVGEIYDEHDRDVQSVRHDPDGSMLVPGAFPIHDLPDIGVDVEPRPGGDYTTIAGLVIALLGHLPTRPGERVRVDAWEAEVAGIERRAITAVRLRPRAAPEQDDEPVEEAEAGRRAG
jgi:putative hemolysin